MSEQVYEIDTEAAGLRTNRNRYKSLKRTFPKKKKSKQKHADLFPGPAPVDEEKLAKYKHFDDDEANFKSIKTDFHKRRLQLRRDALTKSAIAAARAEILNSEDAGFIEPDEGQSTTQISQEQIVNCVDITSATKHFDLSLESTAPYRIAYTRNGRHLLLGGRRGHVAAVDWLTKQLHTEFNCGQTVRDVSWLHIETMLAVAQKEYTYIYDNQGTELHCIKQLHNTNRLDFLPYHFLLVAAGGVSHLHWVDVSVGQLLRTTYTKEGPLRSLTHNPSNAIVHCGHTRGTVTLWSPNVAEPLVKMLCHAAPVTDVAVDAHGMYMATTGADRKLRIWDLRQYRPLAAYLMPVGLSSVTFSERRLLAAACGDSVHIFKDLCSESPSSTPYLTHSMAGATVSALRFAPFEDVLGVGHARGFTSLLVPGAGEPNIDALEANPYQSRKQRREREVKLLLDKIQPEMISLDTSVLARVDQQTLEEKLMERAKILYVRPEVVKFTPRHKMKGKGGTKGQLRAKQHVGDEQRKKHLEKRQRVHDEVKKSRQHHDGDATSDTDSDGNISDDYSQPTEVAKAKSVQPVSVLDRFKRKT